MASMGDLVVNVRIKDKKILDLLKKIGKDFSEIRRLLKEDGELLVKIIDKKIAVETKEK